MRVNERFEGPSPRVHTPQPTALVIEPRPFLALFFQSNLADAGHSTVIVAPVASLAILRRARPATVLFGVDAFGRRPLETFRRTRAVCPAARIIAIVSRDEPAWSALARACGVDTILGPDTPYDAFVAALDRSAELRQENGVPYRTSYVQ